MNCRMCKQNNLIPFLDLGFHPPSDQFLHPEQRAEPVVYYPLEVMLCPDCGLAQLSYVVPPEILYQQDYPYESSTTRTGRRHWAEFAQATCRLLNLNAQDLVVDIGSNVGVLLEAFHTEGGCRILGVEPAGNIALLAQSRGIATVNDFFSVEVASRILALHGYASVITATNVFAHVDNLDALMEAILLLLKDTGIFILEAPYLVNLIKHLEYDTIYHEHLSYLSVKPLLAFFGKLGLEIFDIQMRDIHGGSFRVFVARQGKFPVAPVVAHLQRQEDTMGLHTLPVLGEFRAAVQQNRRELVWLLQRLRREGRRIAGVSAPAKGMTLLNYCRIGNEILDFVTEKSTLKIGRLTPGMQIPVVGDEELLYQRPDYALLLAWNFAPEIMENLQDYQRQGGKFIIPIPTPRVVAAKEEYREGLASALYLQR